MVYKIQNTIFYMKVKDLDLISDSFVKSQVLFTAIELGVFEELGKGGKTIEKLSKKLSCNKESLERFITWLSHMQLIRKRKDIFELNEFSRKYLLEKSPDNRLNWIDGSKFFKNNLWNNLKKAIIENKDQWDKGNRQMWNKHYDNKKKLSKIIRSFDSVSTELGKDIARLIKFKKNSIIVDVGGGSGGLLNSILKKYSNCFGTVIDTGDTIKISNSYYKNLSYISKDFIKENLPLADYFILSWILHDWDDKNIKKILSNCYKHLNKNGFLIICEVLPDSKNKFSYWDIMDGHMMVGTSGKERNLKQYVSLLNNNGFNYLKKFSINESRSIMLFTKV